MTTIIDTFADGLHPDWRVTEVGHGSVRQSPGLLTLTVPPSDKTGYHNAQIADYDGAGAGFRWRPPLRMTVRGRAHIPESGLRGTAGFGFWNQPFMPGQRRVRLPQAVWFFFSSPPNNMALALDVPGAGWKAATFNARRWQFYALLPTAPVGLLLMRIPALYRRLWPIGQRAIGVSEHLLDNALLNDTHTYTLDWQTDRVSFRVDDTPVHETDLAPAGPLGFVAWLDNQYAIVTPQGHFGFGLVDVPAQQALLLEHIDIST